MQCSACRAENRDDRRFCARCGTRLAPVCPSCGFTNDPGDDFCGGCGQEVRGANPPKRLFESPEAYTPRRLAEKILTSREALEGERKQVTVLFADLKGSMELLADRDPDEARTLLDPVLERMMDAVHRFEGTVNQVMGDGIMALFGAPLAHEDHAVRACYAALRMQESVKRYAEEIHRSEGVPIQIRVGLNSGEVVVRSIGSDLHMDYTAVGQTTHLAARMEQMAIPGTILASGETLNLAEGYVVTRPLGPRSVKGLDEPIEVYEITGASMVRSRLQAAAARGLTRFVGRDSELDELRRALDRAHAGHGQVVGVVGEPGVGKSRLYWEFTHSHRTHGWLIIESGSVSYGKATSYLPVIELLKQYFQLEAGDDARKILEKVTGKLLSLDRALEPFLPAFLWLLDAPVSDPDWHRLDPPQRRQRTLDGVKRLLLRESQVQPLIVMFEDLHWIDAETQALLENLVESLPTARLLLLVNYRPEYQHGWSGKSYYRQLRIEPLPPQSCEQLLEALIGHDPSVAVVKPLLVERTEGNPFFLEESVRTMVETGILVGERGAYRLARALGAIQIPRSAHAILASRIDRLSPPNKRLLQSASVVGKDVPFPLLQAIAGEAEDRLRQGLTELQAAEFLYESRLFPELEYTFRHALTHEVAYGSLVTDRRRTSHARLVEAMETLYRDRLSEHVERLAEHAFTGEVWAKAAEYLRQAGARATARSADREASQYFQRALGALGNLPETRETLEQAIDLRFDVRRSLLPLGELDRGTEYLREAEALATKQSDDKRLGWASAYLSANFWLTGRTQEARAFGERAHALAERVGDFALSVAANYSFGAACQASGDFRRAVIYLREAVQSLQGDRNRERYGLTGFPGASARSWLAWALAELGEFEEGIAHGREGIRVAEAVDHPYSLIVACRGLARLYCIKGDFAEAIAVVTRGLSLAHDYNITVFSSLLSSFLGYAYLCSGRTEEARALLEQTLSATEATGAGLYHSLGIVHLGEANLRAGQLEAAERAANQALKIARARGERGYEAWALRLSGDIAAHHGARADASEAYRGAMALAEELEMRPLVAHCHVSFGRVLAAAAEREAAMDHLGTARAMFSGMGMTFWLEGAQAAGTEDASRG